MVGVQYATIRLLIINIRNCDPLRLPYLIILIIANQIYVLTQIFIFQFFCDCINILFAILKALILCYFNMMNYNVLFLINNINIHFTSLIIYPIPYSLQYFLIFVCIYYYCLLIYFIVYKFWLEIFHLSYHAFSCWLFIYFITNLCISDLFVNILNSNLLNSATTIYITIN